MVMNLAILISQLPTRDGTEKEKKQKQLFLYLIGMANKLIDKQITFFFFIGGV